MPLDQETKDFIVKTGTVFNTDLVKQLNKNNEHISKRFDDVGKRLESIEGRLNIMNKDTSIIPQIFTLLETGNSLSQIISDLDLGNVSDESELTGIIQEIIISEPQAVEQAKSNPQTINYLVGKVMQKTKGKADPKLTLDLLKKLIG